MGKKEINKFLIVSLLMCIFSSLFFGLMADGFIAFIVLLTFNLFVSFYNYKKGYYEL